MLSPRRETARFTDSMVHSTVFPLSLSFLKRLACLWWHLSLVTHTQTHCLPSAAFSPVALASPISLDSHAFRQPPQRLLPRCRPSTRSPRQPLRSLHYPQLLKLLMQRLNSLRLLAPRCYCTRRLRLCLSRLPSFTLLESLDSQVPLRLRPWRLLPRRRPTQPSPHRMRMLPPSQLCKLRSRRLTSRHPASWRHRPRRLQPRPSQLPGPTVLKPLAKQLPRAVRPRPKTRSMLPNCKVDPIQTMIPKRRGASKKLNLSETTTESVYDSGFWCAISAPSTVATWTSSPEGIQEPSAGTSCASTVA